jgi:hypothetical protein
MALAMRSVFCARQSRPRILARTAAAPPRYTDRMLDLVPICVAAHPGAPEVAKRSRPEDKARQAGAPEV